MSLTLHGGELDDPVGKTYYGLLRCSCELTLTDFSDPTSRYARTS
ncbi:hypothetical protein [Actinomadura pelletieri]|nr:hypothetical protein [Actinomadura pelletieri]